MFVVEYLLQPQALRSGQRGIHGEGIFLRVHSLSLLTFRLSYSLPTASHGGRTQKQMHERTQRCLSP